VIADEVAARVERDNGVVRLRPDALAPAVLAALAVLEPFAVG
jgi:hypothetical protein